MKGIPCVVVFATLVVLSCWTVDANDRSRRSRNEFILRKCTASVELSRRYPNERSKWNSKESGGSIGRIDGSKRSPESLPENVTSVLQMEKVGSKLNDGASGGRGRTKNVGSTPLKTVNIEAVQNAPLLFRRKSLLPELEHNISGRKVTASQNVVVIKSVT